MSMEDKDKKFKDFVAAVRGHNDIVSTISNYTPLKKSGRNFQGNCPFHLEKTPSFSVNPEKQFFYCFGCQAGGDVIKFVSKIENISYVESIYKLAKLQGLEIPPEIRRPAGADDNEKYSVIYSLLSDATAYFFKVLSSSSKEAEVARNYLYMRGLSNEDIEKYLLGYSFAAPTKFFDAVVKSKKFKISDLEASGLVVKSGDGRYFDRFFGRVVFPVMDRSQRTIAFGGRAILPDAAPKYLNSPETPVYKKNSVFYGINFSHDAIIKSKEVILVEGYFDFLALHRSGIHNVLATCGTALSQNQVRYIENNVNHVIFLYDMDEAGVRATMKNFELFTKSDLKISVVKFEGAKDADEYINKFGVEKTALSISKAEPFTRYLIDFAYKSIGRQSIEAKTSVINFLTPHLRMVRSDLTRNQYISLLSGELGLSEDGIRELVFKSYKNESYGGQMDQKAMLSPETNLKRKAQLDILHVIIQSVDYLSRLLAELDVNSLDAPELREMIELMLGCEGDNATLVGDLAQVFGESRHAGLYAKLYATPLEIDNLERYFSDLILKYNNILRKEKIDGLKLKIREAETMGNFEASNKMLQEVSELQKEIIS